MDLVPPEQSGKAKVVSHSCYVTFQMPEVLVSKTGVERREEAGVFALLNSGKTLGELVVVTNVGSLSDPSGFLEILKTFCLNRRSYS